jgi:tRNA nucleotidyltransferase/poly(A) polymerase
VRRDFTINALYYDPASGAVLDFVGGVRDAQQRVLRLTGWQRGWAEQQQQWQWGQQQQQWE